MIGIVLSVPLVRESCTGETGLFNECSAAAQERNEKEKIACNSKLILKFESKIICMSFRFFLNPPN